jgi:hypothetical protein
MSARSRIVNTLIDRLKEIDGTGLYTSNLSNNVFGKMKFYDEISDYPTVCVISGYESREYLPSDFKWGYLNISLKVYVEGENSQELLENVLSDIEYVIAENELLRYDSGVGEQTAEILITSIQTDEGVMAPLGVGEINCTARYQVLTHIPS